MNYWFSNWHRLLSFWKCLTKTPKILWLFMSTMIIIDHQKYLTTQNVTTWTRIFKTFMRSSESTTYSNCMNAYHIILNNCFKHTKNHIGHIRNQNNSMCNILLLLFVVYNIIYRFLVHYPQNDHEGNLKRC